MDEFAEPVVLCRDPICGSHLSGRGTARPSIAASEAFHRLRRDGRGQDGSGAPTLIHVDGSDRPTGRVMANEADVVAGLARLGFVSVSPGRLDYDDQIDRFAAACVIVDAHGAGLANVGFAPRDCVAIEIMPEPLLQPWIFRLTGLLGQRFAYVFAPLSAGERRRVKTNWPESTVHDYVYRVNVEAVLRAAESACRLVA